MSGFQVIKQIICKTAPSRDARHRADLRKREKQSDDDQYPESYHGIPEWRERTSCPPHQRSDQYAPRASGTEDRPLPLKLVRSADDHNGIRAMLTISSNVKYPHTRVSEPPLMLNYAIQICSKIKRYHTIKQICPVIFEAMLFFFHKKKNSLCNFNGS